MSRGKGQWSVLKKKKWRDEQGGTGASVAGWLDTPAHRCTPPHQPACLTASTATLDGAISHSLQRRVLLRACTLQTSYCARFLVHLVY